MCGISGLWSARREALKGELCVTGKNMVSVLRHRGPDDQGIWVDEAAGLVLGHQRLSIIDLSSSGHQPMVSASGRYVISLNGEIYNFRELRPTLKEAGYPFRGDSDTEVGLAAIEQWGIQSALERFVGMFAFSVWDREKKVLYLARDRIGEKPLYYGHVNGAFVFASELKALRQVPGWNGEINRGALALFLRHGYVPAPYSIYENIFKLPPATLLSVGKAWNAGPLLPVPYWSAREVVGAERYSVSDVDEALAIEQLDLLLRASVAQKMVADVPLGAFLSGGIDSSTIVAIMQAQSQRPVKTYSIGFHEANFNEAEAAKGVAQHLGTDHTELYVTPCETRNVIPELAGIYDEPFADSSQIPTLLVSRVARQGVKVALSGDGGDELFAGYNRHVLGRRMSHLLDRLPGRARAFGARFIEGISPGAWDRIIGGLSGIMPMVAARGGVGDQLHKLADIATANSPETAYRRLVAQWDDAVNLVPGATELPTTLMNEDLREALPEFTERMMYLDLVTYLPDDILVKLDRASMSVGLEARAPYLDHRVVEFAWRLPLSMKIRRGQGKWILRQVLERYVPRQLIERPKMGFGVPLAEWMRGPLREWVESLLDETRLRNQGFVHPEPIREKWREHLAGRRNWQHHLWNILMFQAWHDAECG